MNLFKITVDCLVFAYDNSDDKLKILLIKRNNEPAKDKWALPGGFVRETEEFVETAKRKLFLETGAKNVYLQELKAYSLTDASSDNRIVSIAFYAIIKLQDFAPSATNSHFYQWVAIKNIPPLPFDHGQKAKDGIALIKEHALIKPIVFNLLPAKFSLNQLQKVYEEIYGIELDNRNFRRKIKNLLYIEPLDEMESNVSRRPGMLFKFNKSKFDNSTQSALI